MNAIPMRILILLIIKKTQERLRVQARDKYRNLSEEEKNKKREYGKNRYRNFSGEKKQRLTEYQKNIERQKKSQYNHEWNSFFNCNCNCNFNINNNK